ncbi:aminoglycoside phosphotransferase family protein [Paenibacillus sp. GP183]|jgi:uncharacterized protein (TIGR02172 family)|uniref:phosphotransferase family protein n=1 Tax=Paenibacillus sp. GP183 TaxID=1882751 RepID=UPI00089572C0|nr:aminoglycoside phosphotransferase family protein [Paenibacillus sp. GP183]SEC04378.1 TIGR02172 family protein [Paenibacillus sp. GP183]
MKKGALIGKGMTAEVYEWGQDHAIKFYYDWYEPEWIKHEMENAKAVNEAGVPSPVVFEMIEEGDRLGLIYERIMGPSMLAIMQSSPLKIADCARKMAQLHHNIHRCGTDKLPPQKDLLEKAIRDSSDLLKEKTESVCSFLLTLPSGNRICHGDLHPDNILMTSSKTVAIDWTNANIGNPLCDIARTCLMIRSPFIPPSTSKKMTLAIRVVKKLLHNTYLKEYSRVSNCNIADIDSWILPVAAARLREKVPGEQKWLLNLINSRLQQSHM